MVKNEKKLFYKFMLLWVGELISAIGSGLTSFGLSVYVFHLTGSAGAMALVTLLAFMPTLLLSPLAGVLADRYDRRFLMMLGDGLSGIGVVFILVCLLKGNGALWQICVGVAISSVFSSLMEPAYKATVTDLLSPEQYTKASGLVGIAGSAKYLFSPIIGGILLAVSDIKLLLFLDIITFFITVVSTLLVRKGLKNTVTLVDKEIEKEATFLDQLKAGLGAVSQNRGVRILVVMGAVITLFLGFMQTLSAPMILGFATSATLGIGETICATGMLVSSILMGILSIKKGYAKMLSASLFFAGFFMVMFGLYENMVWICVSGFLFFAMLPFANSSLDYMIRSNIPNQLQGRAWGFIGVISQLGYVIAYSLSGLLADFISKTFDISIGRGAGICITISGVFLCATALLLYTVKSIKSLDKGGEICISE